VRTLLKPILLKKLVALLVAAGFTIHLASCGTILHPERRGQPAGRLDPGIVVLDAVGLLLFFVPGVIAFAVDFSNGTIYLPPESAAVPVVSGELRTVRMSPAELTPERLRDVIRQQTGQTIRLVPGAYRVTRLQEIDDFSGETLARLQHAPGAINVSFPRAE
jgi:hypothetical protein